MIEVIAICGYDPQLLLEDKRSPWRRFGTVTGRWQSRGPEAQRIPMLPPGDRLEFTSVDYGEIEARTIRKANLGYRYQMGGRSFREAIEANARFQQIMDAKAKLLKVQFDARIFEAMIAVYAKFSPVSLRTARLLGSRDPRQRKRGKRLWAKGNEKRVPAWTMEHHDYQRDWYDGPLGEPYDPAKYKKD